MGQWEVTAVKLTTVKDVMTNTVVAVRENADFKEFTGSVERRAEALSMLATIRHLEGVIGVRDRLSYPAEG